MRRPLLALLICLSTLPFLPSAFAQELSKQPLSVYSARRHALADQLPSNGWVLLFAAEEPQLDFDAYRQDPDFYYLTGWNEPGAALLIAAPTEAKDDHPATPYREILFLPERYLRFELYTGVKMDANTPDVTAKTGVAEVAPLARFSEVVVKEVLNGYRNRVYRGLSQQDSPQAVTTMNALAVTLGMDKSPPFGDAHDQVMALRSRKDEGELALLKKAGDASMTAQRAMMKSVKPGVTERDVQGIIVWKLLQNGCERVSYAPIVGSGPNSTVLHYSANTRTMQSGDVVVVDAAGEFSMYASDITRTVPVSGHFTDRQREIYNIVLGAQRAAAEAFVAGKFIMGDPNHRKPSDPPSLDRVAYDYINAHGKDLHGQPLGKYFIHGLGHSVGIDVHDPIDYQKPLDKGMVFTIEPGIYIPEENLGVRIEDVFWVDKDGKLHDFIADLPHTPEDVEAAMKAK
jgi:Xaa-Pro aminopeptidase